MKNVTTKFIDNKRFIDNIITNHKFSSGIEKELIIRTFTITKEVYFIVSYSHFEDKFDNILDALIKYNSYE